MRRIATSGRSVTRDHGDRPPLAADNSDVPGRSSPGPPATNGAGSRSTSSPGSPCAPSSSRRAWRTQTWRACPRRPPSMRHLSRCSPTRCWAARASSWWRCHRPSPSCPRRPSRSSRPRGTAEHAALTAALAILAGSSSPSRPGLSGSAASRSSSPSPAPLGFVFGLALLISIKQIPKLLGIEAHGESALDLVRDIIPHLRETDLLTLAVGLAGIAALIPAGAVAAARAGGPRRAPGVDRGVGRPRPRGAGRARGG